MLIKNPDLSLFEKVDKVHESVTIPLKEFLEGLSDGKWKTSVEQVRDLVSKHSRKSQVVKNAKRKLLPVCTLAGTFSRRNKASLIQHSFYIPFDLDEVENPAELKAKLAAACPYVVACWLSSTGTGLWLIVQVTEAPRNDTEHKSARLTVIEAIKAATGISLDEVGMDDSASDVSRGSYVSYDPYIYINATPQTVEWSYVRTEGAGKNQGSEVKVPTGKPGRDQIQEMLAAIPKRPPYETWIKVIAGVGDCIGEGLSSDDAVSLLNYWSEEEIQGEYLAKLDDRLDAVTVGTLIYLAKQHGWKASASSVKCEVPITTASQWSDPKPLPALRPEADPFNPWILPNAFKDFVTDGAERLQVSPDYIAIPLMVATGSLIGRKVGIRPKALDSWLELPNLWGACVGDPSVMKTPAVNEGLWALKLLAQEALGAYEAAMEAFSAQEQVEKAVAKMSNDEVEKAIKNGRKNDAIAIAQKGNQDRIPKPVLRRYSVNDATVEMLGVLLNENPNGLLQNRDELKGFLEGMERKDHSNDRPFFLEAWTGTGEYTFDRIGRGTVLIKHAILSIIGSIQPGVIARFVKSSLSEGRGADGFIQRFGMLVWPEHQGKWENVDRVPDKAARASVLAVFRKFNEFDPADIGATAEDGGIPFLRFDQTAQGIFNSWLENFQKQLLSSKDHSAFIAHLTKYRKLVPALALIIHLVDYGSGPIRMEAILKASAWAKYLESHARKLYGGSVRNDIAAALEVSRHIRNGDLKDKFTLRDVYRPGWSGLAKLEVAEAGVDYLIALDWLRMEQVQTGGRPLSVYHLNPKIQLDA